MHVLAAAAAAGFGAVDAAEADVLERAEVVARLDAHAAALAAVATVRSALRHELLAPKGDGAGAAIAGLRGELGSVDHREQGTGNREQRRDWAACMAILRRMLAFSIAGMACGGKGGAGWGRVMNWG